MNYVHIGMPKCASSTLQTSFFSKLKNHNYIGPSSLSNVTGEIYIKDADIFTMLHDTLVDAVCCERDIKYENLRFDFEFRN